MNGIKGRSGRKLTKTWTWSATTACASTHTEFRAAAAEMLSVTLRTSSCRMRGSRR